jgi:hypothetical protein
MQNDTDIEQEALALTLLNLEYTLSTARFNVQKLYILRTQNINVYCVDRCAPVT